MRAINTKAIPMTKNSSPITISLSMDKPIKLSMFKNIISF
jgi:hypothetical protein